MALRWWLVGYWFLDGRESIQKDLEVPVQQGDKGHSHLPFLHQKWISPPRSNAISALID